MLKNENIDEMLTRFTKITNRLSSLGDTIDNDQKIRKVIRALPKLGKLRLQPSRSSTIERNGLLQLSLEISKPIK